MLHYRQQMCFIKSWQATLRLWKSRAPEGNVALIFTATVKYNHTVIPDVNFVVIDGKGQALLVVIQLYSWVFYRLCAALVLPSTQITVLCIISTRSASKLVGELKSLEVPIDPGVKLLIQPMRRIPYNLRDKLANKLDELLDLAPVP